MIESLEVTTYPRDGGLYETTKYVLPDWEIVEYELRTMHNWEKPILWLYQNRSDNDRNYLAVCGGSGVYHIQVADAEGEICEALDPHGTEEEVDVWLSDQGFATAKCLTWSTEKAVELVRWFYDHGTRHPGFEWL